MYLSDSTYEGDVYASLSLKQDGTFSAYVNGQKILTDKFNTNYVNSAWGHLNNEDSPFIFGKTATGDDFYYHKQMMYSIKIYNRALEDKEILLNYNSAVSYHNILVNGGEASTGGNTGGENLNNIN